jgi:hypothetical protein
MIFLSSIQYQFILFSVVKFEKTPFKAFYLNFNTCDQIIGCKNYAKTIICVAC